jgi:hypothetical protein
MAAAAVGGRSDGLATPSTIPRPGGSRSNADRCGRAVRHLKPASGILFPPRLRAATHFGRSAHVIARQYDDCRRGGPGVLCRNEDLTEDVASPIKGSPSVTMTNDQKKSNIESPPTVSPW